MTKKIKTALISVFNKDGLENILNLLKNNNVKIYSTGGTQKFIEDLGIPCIPVELITTYPSILGGRVKTLHPSVFGGILGRRENEKDREEMAEYKIPEIDLVIVDLYPFEKTLQEQKHKVIEGGELDEAAIIEKIDIGGPSMIRAAAKNFKDVVVIAADKEYSELENLLNAQSAETTLEQRKHFAATAFEVVAHYDVAIAKYFNPSDALYFLESIPNRLTMRYGENPHQQGMFYGNLAKLFTQLNGKELSYNNLADVEAAVNLIHDIKKASFAETVFAIIKHTNVCGMAIRNNLKAAWDAALASDIESAFGGVLITNATIDVETATAINEIFFEVLIAHDFTKEALDILKRKKNRILLQLKSFAESEVQYRSVLNGVLIQSKDEGNYTDWKEEGGRASALNEKEDLEFANIICKHLKSNAIAIVKNKQLIGKGCGQTSRIDALKNALLKAQQFNFSLQNAVLASDAFFPFDDCVKIAHGAGISAFIQPGGSIRDKDSIEYCRQNKLAMVITGMRHFKH